jgi:hypothetical protein
MLKIVAGTQNEPQADLIIARLAEIGITAISQLSLGNPEMGSGGGRMIYVEERDVERARELLAIEEQPFSDDELARLSEEAARKAREP